MLLEELVKPEGVLCNAQARSKKHCLEILSELLVRPTPEISNEQIFENLIKRERLGCTSLGRGVAFPHCRIDGIETCNGALILLSEPVDFDAHDGEPVDLVFGLLVPEKLEDDHSRTIKMVTSIFADDGLRSRLRSAKSSSDLYEALLDGSLLAAPQCA
jgi:PTS system nitrogen regulatory IIA component